MKEIILISIGRLRDRSILILEKEYFNRLNGIKIKIVELKSCSEDIDRESDLIIKKINDISTTKPPYIVLLTERGKLLSSEDFSKWLFDSIEKYSNRKIVFIIGGAAGFSKRIYEKADNLISLSSLTFPHQLVRAIFAEQIYRAETIYKNHPYHK